MKIKAPMVEHPERPGIVGIFVSAERADSVNDAEGIYPVPVDRVVMRHGRAVSVEPPSDMVGEIMAEEWREFLLANEFDVSKDFEVIKMRFGLGFFYL